MTMPRGLILAAMVLVGCSGPGTSPNPGAPDASGGPQSSAPPEATVLPSPSPQATQAGLATEPPQPTGPALSTDALLLNSLVYVAVDRLNMRAKPSLDAKILDVVKQGDFLRIDEAGPYVEDGYIWYGAAFLANAGEPPNDSTVEVRFSGGIVGYIAVGRQDASYVTRLGPRCPATVDLPSIQHLLGAELLACFGRTTLELRGTFGCGGCGGSFPGVFEPNWLANPMNFAFLSVTPAADRVGPFDLHFAPGGPEAPPAGSVIRVLGHFDDPAASTCTVSVIHPLHPAGEDLSADDFVAVPPEAANLACRQRFVVDSVEILGTDPTWGT
jgi:hypothetical protein